MDDLLHEVDEQLGRSDADMVTLRALAEDIYLTVERTGRVPRDDQV